MSFVEVDSLHETLELVNLQCATTQFDVLICVGGDGFVHDLLSILIRYQLALLVIPAGTGNDFSRTLGLHRSSYKTLLDSLNTSTPTSIDIALVRHGETQTPFVQILSTGFDSVVNERANNFRRVRGSIKYAVAVFLEVWKFRSINFDILIDELQISGNAMLVCVANGNSYGAGMKIAPSAKNDDGTLEVMVVDHVSPFRLLMVFPRVFIGTHVNHPKVHFYSGSKISISGDTWAFADGEKISHLPVEVTISDMKLQVYRS
jgi:diacylglycerol kinase (ATP)